MDTISPAARSLLMARIKSKNTKPEMLVRKLVFSMGFRYRLHGRKLPGTPDLVFAGRKKVIFVHGCFWHRHAGCKLASVPKSREEFWLPKFAKTVARDQRFMQALEALGWGVLVIWECELKDMSAVRKRLLAFLNAGTGAASVGGIGAQGART